MIWRNFLIGLWPRSLALLARADCCFLVFHLLRKVAEGRKVRKTLENFMAFKSSVDDERELECLQRWSVKNASRWRCLSWVKFPSHLSPLSAKEVGREKRDRSVRHKSDKKKRVFSVLSFFPIQHSLSSFFSIRNSAFYFKTHRKLY